MSSSNLTQTFAVGLWKENPVFRLLLGMCPALAVSAAVKPALTMGGCVIFVLICSGIVVSSLRNLLKPHLRILMFTLTIATFVTIADIVVKAFLPEMSTALGPYLPLIIVNCIIICRAEACASKSNLVVSVTDAIGMGLGFTIALTSLAAIREILATGEIFEIQILEVIKFNELGEPISGWFYPWGAMALPVGAFVTLGLMLGLINLVTKKQ